MAHTLDSILEAACEDDETRLLAKQYFYFIRAEGPQAPVRQDSDMPTTMVLAHACAWFALETSAKARGLKTLLDIQQLSSAGPAAFLRSLTFVQRILTDARIQAQLDSEHPTQNLAPCEPLPAKRPYCRTCQARDYACIKARGEDRCVPCLMNRSSCQESDDSSYVPHTEITESVPPTPRVSKLKLPMDPPSIHYATYPIVKREEKTAPSPLNDVLPHPKLSQSIPNATQPSAQTTQPDVQRPLSMAACGSRSATLGGSPTLNALEQGVRVTPLHISPQPPSRPPLTVSVIRQDIVSQNGGADYRPSEWDASTRAPDTNHRGGEPGPDPMFATLPAQRMTLVPAHQPPNLVHHQANMQVMVHNPAGPPAMLPIALPSFHNLIQGPNNSNVSVPVFSASQIPSHSSESVSNAGGPLPTSAPQAVHQPAHTTTASPTGPVTVQAHPPSDIALGKRPAHSADIHSPRGESDGRYVKRAKTIAPFSPAESGSTLPALATPLCCQPQAGGSQSQTVYAGTSISTDNGAAPPTDDQNSRIVFYDPRTGSSSSCAAPRYPSGAIHHHIKLAAYEIVRYAERHGCQDIDLWLRILDLRTRLIELDHMSAVPANTNAGPPPGHTVLLSQLAQAVWEYQCSLVNYEKEHYCPDIHLKMRIMDLATRLTLIPVERVCG